MQRPMRFAFLTALILCWSMSLAMGQLPVTRPAISEEVSPVEEFSVETQDGPPAVGVVRRPPGPGPFPAVVIPISFTVNQLKTMALNNPTMTRFLAAGYVTVMYAGPRRGELPSSDNYERQLNGMITGTLAIVDHVKNMPKVDPHSVVLYGWRVGGVVLDVAGATEVAAVAAEEPNGMWMLPLMAFAGSRTEFIRATEDPHRVFTPAIREANRERFRTISGPVFIAQGDQPLGDAYDPHKVLSEILIPDLKAAGLEVEDVVYSGQKHAFGLFGTADRGVANDGVAAASRFFADMDAFFKRHLPTQPQAVDDSLVEDVPVTGTSQGSP